MDALEKIYNLDSCCLLLLSFGDDHNLCYNKKLIKKNTLQFNTFDNIVLFIAYIYVLIIKSKIRFHLFQVVCKFVQCFYHFDINFDNKMIYTIIILEYDKPYTNWFETLNLPLHRDTIIIFYSSFIRF